MLGALYAIARPSVCPSVTRVDQSKTVEVMIMQFSPNPPVFPGKFYPEIPTGYPWAGTSNKGRVGKTSHFSTFMHQYLQNGTRYIQSYYWWLIGSCICAFDWHQGRWPWMTLNWKTTYLHATYWRLLAVNISHVGLRTAVAHLPLHQQGFLVLLAT